MFDSSSSEVSSRGLQGGSEISSIEETEDTSFNDYILHIKKQNKPKKGISEKSQLKKRFNELSQRIVEENMTIQKLRGENKALRLQIRIAQEKIQAYPIAKKRFDKLSTSISNTKTSPKSARSISRSSKKKGSHY